MIQQGYPGYQIPQTYQPQTYRPVYQPQPMQMQQAMDPGAINARYVTGREEAVAAQIIPDGNIYLFYDPTNRRIYAKRFNPQTNSAEFMEFSGPAQQPQQAAQYAPIDAVAALDQRVGRIEQMLTAQAQPRQRQQKNEETGT